MTATGKSWHSVLERGRGSQEEQGKGLAVARFGQGALSPAVGAVLPPTVSPSFPPSIIARAHTYSTPKHGKSPFRLLTQPTSYCHIYHQVSDAHGARISRHN